MARSALASRVQCTVQCFTSEDCICQAAVGAERVDKERLATLRTMAQQGYDVGVLQLREEEDLVLAAHI